MSRELFTSWGEVQSAIDRLLALACHEIQLYDQDLAGLKLDSSPRLEELTRLLRPSRPDCLRIALRDTAPLQRECPRLMGLVRSYPGSISVQKTPDELSHLCDTMLLVDSRHGLILFDRRRPRSKLLIDENDELVPYLRRFEDIWSEGGTPVSSTILGL